MATALPAPGAASAGPAPGVVSRQLAASAQAPPVLGSHAKAAGAAGAAKVTL